MKIFRVLVALLSLAVLGTAFVTPSRADSRDKKTVLTFSHPVEVPGKVILPAGKYVFKLHDSSYRNIVQIWNADESQIITTILAISDYRLTPTEGTVIEFHERAGNAPNAVRAWFYPGEQMGREFVYPKSRAEELARTNDVIVPAETVAATPSELATVPLVAITPEAKEEPVEEAIETTPQSVQVAENVTSEELPRTASTTPLIALIGVGLIGTALGLRRLAQHS